MGNEASVALATAQAKSKFNSTMSQIDEKLQGQPKTDTQLAGCANRKESKQRRKLREAEYKQKKDTRTARKKEISEMWAANRQTK